MVPLVLRSLVWPDRESATLSGEEQLADAVDPIGPLLAIGRPGEQLPTPGATRVYADDDQWRALVERWLSMARLVILRPGTSPGVQWEIERSIAIVNANRFLILMIRMRSGAYESFSDLLRTRFEIVLPEFKSVAHWRRVSGFIEFDADWRAAFLPLWGPLWPRQLFTRMQRRFYYSLRPVFVRLGVDWTPLPPSREPIVWGFVLVYLILITLGAL